MTTMTPQQAARYLTGTLPADPDQDDDTRRTRALRALQPVADGDPQFTPDHVDVMIEASLKTTAEFVAAAAVIGALVGATVGWLTARR